MKKIIILFIIVNLSIYFFFNQKKYFHKNHSNYVQKNNKEYQISKDQDITSYFLVFIIFNIIFNYLLKTLMIKLCRLWRYRYLKKQDPIIKDYLIFIERILEMTILENCYKVKKGDLYKEKLEFDKTLFLNKFLFDEQTNKNIVRQQAHDVIFQYRNFFQLQFSNWNFFLRLIFNYLLIFIVNLIVNFCQHGRKLKCHLNDLWMMIPHMKYKDQRIYCYISIFSLILCHFGKNIFFTTYSPIKDHLYGRYYLLREMLKEILNNKSFKIINITKNGKAIPHCNLDKNKLEYFDEDVDQISSNFNRIYLEKFVKDKFSYFKDNDHDEIKIEKSITNFFS